VESVMWAMVPRVYYTPNLVMSLTTISCRSFWATHRSIISITISRRPYGVKSQGTKEGHKDRGSIGATGRC
jgi:hypothetical protein